MSGPKAKREVPFTVEQLLSEGDDAPIVVPLDGDRSLELPQPTMKQLRAAQKADLEDEEVVFGILFGEELTAELIAATDDLKPKQYQKVVAHIQERAGLGN